MGSLPTSRSLGREQVETEGKRKQGSVKIKSRSLTYEHEIPVTKVRQFWDGLAEGKVMATRCKRCGERYYPPQTDCARCLVSEMEWFQVSERAVLLTFTESRLRPQGFTQYPEPYTIAIAEAAEGIKVMGWLEMAGEPEVGMVVRVATRVQPDGFPVIVFSSVNDRTDH